MDTSQIPFGLATTRTPKTVIVSFFFQLPFFLAVIHMFLQTPTTVQTSYHIVFTEPLHPDGSLLVEPNI